MNQQMTGQVGVFGRKSERIWHQLQQSDLDDFYSCKAASDASSYVRAILKFFGCEIRTSKRRPSGVAYRRWLCCLHLNIPTKLLIAVDQLLEQHRVSPRLYVQKAFRGFKELLRVFLRTEAQDPKLFGLDVACVSQAAVGRDGWRGNPPKLAPGAFAL